MTRDEMLAAVDSIKREVWINGGDGSAETMRKLNELRAALAAEPAVEEAKEVERAYKQGLQAATDLVHERELFASERDRLARENGALRKTIADLQTTMQETEQRRDREYDALAVQSDNNVERLRAENAALRAALTDAIRAIDTINTLTTGDDLRRASEAARAALAAATNSCNAAGRRVE